MSNSLVYMTAASADEARAIGRALVEARLAACVNIIDGMRSIYRWDGNIEEAGETVLIAKTRTVLVDALTEKVREMHSHDCPCVVGIPIDGGNGAFHDWIAAETG